MQPLIARPLGLEECRRVLAALRASIEEEIAAEMTESYIARHLFIPSEPIVIELEDVVATNLTLLLSYSASE